MLSIENVGQPFVFGLDVRLGDFSGGGVGPRP